MIVVMKPGASQKQIAHIVSHIEQLGLRSHVIVGTERTVIAALGEKRDGAKQALETGEGVEKVVPILAPYKMASTEVKKERTRIEVMVTKAGPIRVRRRARRSTSRRNPQSVSRRDPRPLRYHRI